jgi:hypothetical protein
MEGRTEQAQGYRKEAERYAELASSGQRDITSFVHKSRAIFSPGRGFGASRE